MRIAHFCLLSDLPVTRLSPSTHIYADAQRTGVSEQGGKDSDGVRDSCPLLPLMCLGMSSLKLHSDTHVLSSCVHDQTGCPLHLPLAVRENAQQSHGTCKILGVFAY